jgi:hypothetical protein
MKTVLFVKQKVFRAKGRKAAAGPLFARWKPLSGDFAAVPCGSSARFANSIQIGPRFC